MSIGFTPEAVQRGSSRFPEKTPEDEINEKKIQGIVFDVLSRNLVEELASRTGGNRDEIQASFLQMRALREADLEMDLSSQKELQRLRDLVNTLDAGNLALAEKLMAAGANQGLLQKELKSLREKVQSLENDKADLMEQFRISTAKLASSQKDPDGLRRIGFLEAENKKLSEDLRSQKKSMTATQLEKQTAEKKVRDLGEELQSFQAKHRSLLQSVADAKKASVPEKEKIHQLQTQLDAITKENQILLHQLNLANAREASAREAESRASDRAREEMISMRRELEELKELLRIQLSLAGKEEIEKGNLKKVTDAALATAEAEKQGLVRRVSLLSAELESVSAVLKTREQEGVEMTKKLEEALARIRQLTLVRYANRPRPDISPAEINANSQ